MTASKKKKPKAKTLASAIAVPQTKEGANDAIREIGSLERRIAKLNIGFQEAAAKVKETHEALAQPLADERDRLVKAVEAYCAAHRDELTDNGKVKTASFAAGLVSWRHRPPACTLPKDRTAIIDYMKLNGLKRFLRITTDVSKEALLAEADAAKKIPGVKIGSAGEDFTVEPFTTDDLEAVQS